MSLTWAASIIVVKRLKFRSWDQKVWRPRKKQWFDWFGPQLTIHITHKQFSVWLGVDPSVGNNQIVWVPRPSCVLGVLKDSKISEHRVSEDSLKRMARDHSKKTGIAHHYSSLQLALMPKLSETTHLTTMIIVAMVCGKTTFSVLGGDWRPTGGGAGGTPWEPAGRVARRT